MGKLITILLFTVSLTSLANEIESREDRFQFYDVQKSDSLMLIAFKIYGDYRKWKELALLNPHLKQTAYDLSNIEKIKFKTPDKLFKWEPLGNSYLIQDGDTLQKISKKVYATTRRWREIYENNKPLIPEENIIFAGFTLYYIPDPPTSSK